MFRVEVYLRVRRAVMVEGMSIREASRMFGLHRDTVRKMLAYSVPPGYRRQTPPGKPKLSPYTGVIDRILEDDLGRPKKQRHTAKRIFERLRDEYGFDGQYTIVKDFRSAILPFILTTRRLTVNPAPLKMPVTPPLLEVPGAVSLQVLKLSLQPAPSLRVLKVIVRDAVSHHALDQLPGPGLAVLRRRTTAAGGRQEHD